MPSYKVTAPGFFDGKLYSPEGKRPILYTDTPFSKKNPMPSWLEEMSSKESTAARKKHEAQEKADAAAQEKAAQDRKDIEDASFLGSGESSPGSTVETI